jgi:NitT/TauT family transport system substrate-binding protein
MSGREQKLQRWSVIGVLLLCILSLTCLVQTLGGSPMQSEAVLKIAVNVTTIESFPVFAAAGSRVQLVAAPNGRIAMAQLVSGAVDAATGSETQALLNSVADPRIRIVMTLSECRYRIIARRSAGIRQISDLRGKAIAVTPNTSSQYYLSRMLKKAGVAESNVRIVLLEGQEMPSALEKRRVDAVSIWEPHAQNSLQAIGSEDAVVLEDPAAYTERFNLNSRSDVLADPVKRRALQEFVREVVRASESLRTRGTELIPSLAPKVGLTPQMVMSVWQQFKFPGAISTGLRTLLTEVEPWVAKTQNRQPRTSRELAGLIDDSLFGGRVGNR